MFIYFKKFLICITIVQGNQQYGFNELELSRSININKQVMEVLRSYFIVSIFPDVLKLNFAFYNFQ